MPHAASPPRVQFSPEPIYSRLPHDDEAYVMRAFTKHASHCPACADPYAMHKAGGTLCQRGHRRAADVAQYVYNKRGTAYSVVDREGESRALVQIEIPAKLDAVKSLLRAMERGMRVGNVATEGFERKRYGSGKPRTVEIHSSSSSDEDRDYRDAYRKKSRKEKPAPIFTGGNYANAGRKVYMTRGEMAEKDMRARERYYGRDGYYQPHMIYSPAPVAVGGYYYR